MFPFKGMFQSNDRLPRPNHPHHMQPPHVVAIPNLHLNHHQQQHHHHISALQHQQPIQGASDHHQLTAPPPPIVGTTQWPLNKADYQDLANDQVDWAALAQQWIHMKETCTTDDLLAAPPPPIISQSENAGQTRSIPARSRLHEEKGEAPMEMDRDDDDHTQVNPTTTHHHNPFMINPSNMGNVLPQLNQPPPNWNNSTTTTTATGQMWQHAPPPPPTAANPAQWNKSKYNLL